MERIIKIIDSGLSRYTLNPNHIILGKMYDNESEELVIERPEIEQDSICILIVADVNGKIIDNIDMTNNRYKIKCNLSQYSRIQLGFSFSRADGYIKNSEIALGDFEFALNPNDIVPSKQEESIIKNNIELMKIADIVGNNLDGGEFATDDEYIEAEEKFQIIASRIMGVEI